MIQRGPGSSPSQRARKPIRVLCVDDNDLVAEGIRIKLDIERGGFEWIGQLRDANHLVQEAFRTKPNVILLDIDMPGKDAFEALHEVSELFPNVRVLMLSGHVRRELIERAIEAGAWGYISKHEGADLIIDAIERVTNGEFALGPDVQREYRRT